MPATRHRPFRLAAGCGLTLASLLTAAQPANMTPGEVSLTHPVCEDAQGMPAGWVQHFRHSPRAPYWEGLLGKTFWDVHHYCWALIHMQRAQRPGVPKQERDHTMRVAIRDYYYVIHAARRNGDDKMPLLPELFYRSGEAYVLLGEYPQAIAEFERSREAKADYWPPYVAQASLHHKLGMVAQARELLESGLKLMPDDPNLQEALRKIGRGGAAASDTRRPAAGGPRRSPAAAVAGAASTAAR
ncbi:MAG: tetratricopeptide repeat protein [Rubrivivax sp.]|nr:tetratricopeptide repeat protein [Rubrivivax sp.]